MKQLIYLASPHSHTSSLVRLERYEEALRCNTWLVRQGFWIYSPIVSSHYVNVLDEEGWKDNKKGWEYWKEFDTEMIKRCDELWVLEIKGTADSVGVRAEVEIAKELKKPIYHIWPKEFAQWAGSKEDYVAVREEY